MKKILSVLLVAVMMFSVLSLTVAAEATTIGDICRDADGNALTPHLVDDRAWVVSGGELYADNNWDPAYLVFDEELNANKIEFTLNCPAAIGGQYPTDRNYMWIGVMFALTDYDNDYSFVSGDDVSYYILRVSVWNTVSLLHVGKGAAGGYRGIEPVSGVGDLDDVGGHNVSDIATNGVKLSVEWNDEGDIVVYVNGNEDAPIVYKDTDANRPNGDGYGIAMYPKFTASGGEYTMRSFTSFVAGVKSENEHGDTTVIVSLIALVAAMGTGIVIGKKRSFN